MRTLLVLLLLAPKLAHATPACEAVAERGAAALDAEGAVTLLSPAGGQLRRLVLPSGGAVPEERGIVDVAPESASVGPSAVRLFVADASAPAFVFSGNGLYRLDGTGARRTLDCADSIAPTEVAADRGAGRWLFATVCGDEVVLSTLPDGGGAEELARRPLAAGRRAPIGLAVADSAAGGIAVAYGSRISRWRDGQWEDRDFAASGVDAIQLARDEAGITAFALNGAEIVRIELEGWGVEVRPRPDGDSIGTLQVVDRRTLWIALGQAPRRLVAGDDGWRIDAVRDLPDGATLRAVRGDRLLVEVPGQGGSNVEVLDAGRPPAGVGAISVITGEEGACGGCLAIPGAHRSGLPLWLWLAAAAALRGTRRRPTTGG